MISLKQTPEADSGTVTSSDDRPYGYGTCISLSDEQVKALGLTNVKIGAKVKITAFGIVEQLRAEVERRLLAGTPVTGFKLVQGQAWRTPVGRRQGRRGDAEGDAPQRSR